MAIASSAITAAALPSAITASALPSASTAAALSRPVPCLLLSSTAIATASSRLLCSNPTSSPFRHRRLLPLRRRGPPPTPAITAVALPSLTPSVATVINLARPLPRLLLSSISSLPAHISAAAARATPTPAQLAALRAVFAAALANRPPAEYFQAPLQALASGTATCIALYAEILNLRVTLMWFPNIPWERQPFSALRDLCDPFLTLCRMFLPPVKKLGNLDLSPLLAFWVLGVISSILSGTNPSSMY